MDNFDFASCKIDPEAESGTLMIANNNLWKCLVKSKNKQTSTKLFTPFTNSALVNKSYYKLGMIPSVTMVGRTKLNKVVSVSTSVVHAPWIVIFNLLDKN